MLKLKIKHSNTALNAIKDVKKIIVESVNDLTLDSIIDDTSLDFDGQRLDTKNDIYTRLNTEKWCPNLSTYAYYNNVPLGLLFVGKNNIPIKGMYMGNFLQELIGCKIIGIAFNEQFSSSQNVIFPLLIKFCENIICNQSNKNKPNNFYFDYVWVEANSDTNIQEITKQYGLSVADSKYLLKSIDSNNRSIDLSFLQYV